MTNKHVLPVYVGRSSVPTTFAQVDEEFHSVLLPYRWLLRPRTSEGFIARMFVDQHPVGLHQLVYMLLNQPDCLSWLSLTGPGLRQKLQPVQERLPKITFRNSNGLDCRVQNLHYIIRSVPGLTFPPDDPIYPEERTPEILPPETPPPEEQPVHPNTPPTDKTSRLVQEFLFGDSNDQ